MTQRTHCAQLLILSVMCIATESAGANDTLAAPAAASISADGLRMATAVVHDDSVALSIWDTEKMKKFALKTIPGFSAVDSIQLSPNGGLLAIAELERWMLFRITGNRIVAVIDSSKLKERADRSHGAFSFSSDGRLFASGCFGITIWDTTNAKLTGRVSVEQARFVKAVQFGEHNDHIAFSTFKVPDNVSDLYAAGVVEVWNWKKQHREWRLPALTQEVRFLAWVSGHIVTISDNLLSRKDSEVVVWDVKKQNIVQRLRGHRRRIASLAVSSDGTKLAIADVSGAVAVWNASKWIRECEFSVGDRQTSALSFDSKGVSLLSTSGEGSCVLFDIVNRRKRVVKYQ